MRIHKEKKTTLFMMVIVLLFLTMACQPAEKPNPNDIIDSPNNDNDTNMGDGDFEMDMENDEENPNTLGNRAESIADGIVDLKGINDAAVVLTGDTALVGVDIGNQSKGTMIDDIKQNVQDAVKKVDKEVDRVIVTADADTFQRIDNMAHDINKGEPVSGFTNEIEEMINRMAPSIE